MQGWALRGAKKTVHFNENQRQYLDDKFEIEQESGHKADPEIETCDTRELRKASGVLQSTSFRVPSKFKATFRVLLRS